MKLAGWVAGWTDGSGEITILSVWSEELEARDACQQDVRDGEDMGAESGPDGVPMSDDERFELEWEMSEQINGFIADCENGQGTYFVHEV